MLGGGCPLPLTKPGNWVHPCKGQFSQQLCPWHPAADLVQHNSTCTSERKTSWPKHLVIGNLRPPSGLQWTRNNWSSSLVYGLH